MSLGKRWITTLESDGQIVDFKRDMYMNERAALASADVDAIAKSKGWKVGAIVVDLDDAERTTPPPSLDEQHQHAERMATKWLARYQELSAEVGRVPGTCEPVDERRHLTAEELGALGEVRRVRLASVEDVGYYSVSDTHHRYLISGIAKLLAANAGRQR